MNKNFLLSLLVFMIACNSNTENKNQEMKYKNIGTIERFDAALDNIISDNAKPEIIAEGFEWSEGPCVEQQNILLFSTFR
jgi:gluconolactonase